MICTAVNSPDTRLFFLPPVTHWGDGETSAAAAFVRSVAPGVFRFLLSARRVAVGRAACVSRAANIKSGKVGSAELCREVRRGIARFLTRANVKYTHGVVRETLAGEMRNLQEASGGLSFATGRRKGSLLPPFNPEFTSHRPTRSYIVDSPNSLSRIDFRRFSPRRRPTSVRSRHPTKETRSYRDNLRSLFGGDEANRRV